MRLLNPSRRVPILGTDFDTQAAGLSNLRIETYSIQASNQAATRKLLEFSEGSKSVLRSEVVNFAHCFAPFLLRKTEDGFALFTS